MSLKRYVQLSHTLRLPAGEGHVVLLGEVQDILGHSLVIVLDHILLIEQGGGAVADGVEQVGTGPVEDGHEVVADDLDAELGQVADFAVRRRVSGGCVAVMGAMIYAVIRGRGHIEDLSARQVVIMAAFSLYFGFTSEGVDNAAHVGGLICGFLLAVLLYHPSQRAG